MGKIYHGCGLCYEDRTDALISKSSACLNPTSYLFWKDPVDASNRMKTKKQIKNTTTASIQYILTYLEE